MQTIHILKESTITNSFNNDCIKSIFDITQDKVIYEKEHKLFYDEMQDWSIGVIYGNSGSGKTLLGKEIAKRENIPIIEFLEWDNSKNIIENFSSDNLDLILEYLSNVGLNTQPSYLKSYSVLSNGEKMRVNIARALFENDYLILDEFSSVVDRDIVKIICKCINKLVMKYNKKLICISCHKDYFDYLQPQWTYNVDTQEFKKDLLWQRITNKYYIIQGSKDDWQLFRHYHYLSHKLPSCTDIFLLLDSKENKIGFIAFKTLPHKKSIKQVARLVILPDYQGIGLGNIFLTKTCAIIKRKYPKHIICIATSLKLFIKSLQKNKNFKCKIITATLNARKNLNKTIKYRRGSFTYEATNPPQV